MKSKKPAKKTKYTEPVAWSEYRKTAFTAQELAENDAEIDRELALMRLRRELGVTQVQLAEQTGMTQGSLSRFEQQKDALVSTMREYVRGLGAELRLVAWFDDSATGRDLTNGDWVTMKVAPAPKPTLSKKKLSRSSRGAAVGARRPRASSTTRALR